MIITNRTEKFYKLEMTAAQAADLQLFLEAGQEKHISEFEAMEKYGAQVADSVRETLHALRHALENR